MVEQWKRLIWSDDVPWSGEEESDSNGSFVHHMENGFFGIPCKHRNVKISRSWCIGT